MATKTHSVWAIDVGTCSLKALRLLAEQDYIEVISSDFLEHSRILSAPGVDSAAKEKIIAETLRQFLARNDVTGDEVAISIAGQNSFARFIKLPPVELKKIPEIVQFEAIQQIPFDINEVEWDWQLMEIPDSPDTEVGIFAIKNELISEIMDHFTKANLRIACVQIAPVALFNYLVYDRKDLADIGQKATVILDIGATDTTLVVCTKNSIWQRSIRIGGNSFTQAIADAFKIPFDKAEKLKRTAPVSKYMRQIYTAMKPVYTELSGELQRSLGFYTSSGTGHDKGFARVIALGGGMKLQGLTKYLQQTLGIPLIKPDSFERLKPAPDVSAAKLHENICDFGVVYGLGVQLYGQARINVNLLPKKIARAMTWTRKARIFTAAAGLLLAVTLLALGRAFRDRAQFNANQAVRGEISQVVSEARNAISKLSEEQNKDQPLDERIQKQFDLFKYRHIVPAFNEALITCLPNINNTDDLEQRALLEAFEKGDTAAILAVPRPKRKMVFVTRVYIEYQPDLENAPFPQGGRNTPAGQPRQRAMTPESLMMYDMLIQETMGGQGMPQGGPGMPPGGPAGYQMPSSTGQPTATEEAKSGFVVVIEGFSPYEKISDLLHPFGVAADKSRWGIITRFENLAKIIKNTPFELFDIKDKDTVHFNVQSDLVDLADTKMPLGIGVRKEVRRVPEQVISSRTPMAPMYDALMPGAAGPTQDRIVTENVLVDPMTGEEMSKTYDIITEKDLAENPELTEKDLGRKNYKFGKEMFIERDSWFRIQAKFVWKDAPKIADPSGGMPGYGMPMY